MLSEMIGKIKQLADEANTPRVLPDEQFGAKRYLMPDGTIHTFDSEPLKRKHTVTSLDSLETAIATYRGKRAAVWVSFDQLKVILDDDEFGENSVRLELKRAPLFNLLLGLQEIGDPKVLVNFFRHDCYTADVHPEGVAAALSNLRFVTQDEDSRTLTTTADSMGKSIRAEVSGTANLPERVEISFQPWPRLDIAEELRVNVPCRLNVDAGERLLSLVPLPGAIETAKNEATAYLINYLHGELSDCVILAGTP